MDFDIERFNSSKMVDFYITLVMRDAVLCSCQEVAGFSDGSMYVWVPNPEPESQHNINDTRGHD